MKAEQYIAQGIVAGRTRPTQDPVWAWEAELAREEARRERRRLRGL